MPTPEKQENTPEISPQDEVILDSEIKEDLQGLENEIQTKQIHDMTENINKEPDFKIESNTLATYIEKKERGKAIKEIFTIIGKLFSDKNTTGFKEFKPLEEKLKNINLSTVSKEKLEEYILYIESYIEKTEDIKKDIKLTYVLSEIKDQFTKVNNPGKEMNTYQLFSKNIKPGSILLFNKKVQKKDIGASLLRAYDQNFETDFVHSAIVSDIGENGEISILHSTTDDYKKSGETGGVREEPLKNYFERGGVESCDFLVLQADEINTEKMMTYAKSNIGKGYDTNAAIGGGLYGKDSDGSGFSLKKGVGNDDDVFNCVEIIAKGLDIGGIQNITQPNEFLKFMQQLKPSYITTIQNKEIK